MAYESRLELATDDDGRPCVRLPENCIGGHVRSTHHVQRMTDRELLERIFLILEDAQRKDRLTVV